MRSVIQLRRGKTVSTDKLVWKWLKGAEFFTADIGSPTSADTYALCVYDSTANVQGVAVELIVTPSNNWTDKLHRGFKYYDRDAQDDGVQLIKIKPSSTGQSLVVMKAKGANLPIPEPALAAEYFEQDPEVVVKLVSTSGTCWASTFTTADTLKNTLRMFSASVR